MVGFQLCLVVLVAIAAAAGGVGETGGHQGTQTDRRHGVDMGALAAEVRDMFMHAYNGYMMHAFPLDELRPLTCDGHDTWGSFSLSLVDALDTLVVMGNHEEFRRAARLVVKHLDPNKNINVSVFETNIRVVGGLLSAHLLSRRAGLELEPGWPCAGPLLRLSEAFARKLLPAFNTSTGMPYGTVNLLRGVPPGETPVTCTAGVTTFILEFGALSRLTGDPTFETVALRALHAMWRHRSRAGLVGNHIDVVKGKWTATDSGIGAGVDSYFEYLLKGSVLFRRPELRRMFDEHLSRINEHMRHDDWHFWVNMDKASVSMPVFQSLEAFWPGLLTLVGDLEGALKTLHNYHQVWKQFGFTPEFFSVPKGEPMQQRNSYPLRPELIESIMLVYRATKDPTVLQMGIDIMRSINTVARTSCGYATIYDVRTHQLENRMESFFLAETTKYLYLLFDEENFLHAGTTPENLHQHYRVVHTVSGGECVIGAGGYVFNTEAHPIDPGALYCCSDSYHKDLVQLDQMHRHYPLLRLLNISDYEIALASISPGLDHPEDSLPDLGHRPLSRDRKGPLPPSDETDARGTLLSCPNTRFHFKFMLYGEMIDLDEKEIV